MGKKKLFVSCPMYNRDKEWIKATMEKMKRIAEIYYDQELELIPSYIENILVNVKNKDIYYMAKAIAFMDRMEVA